LIQENLNTLQLEVRFVSPKDNSTDNFAERVTISVENLVQPTSLKEYTLSAIAQIKASNIIIEPPQETTSARRKTIKITCQEKDGN